MINERKKTEINLDRYKKKVTKQKAKKKDEDLLHVLTICKMFLLKHFPLFFACEYNNCSKGVRNKRLPNNRIFFNAGRSTCTVVHLYHNYNAASIHVYTVVSKKNR